MMNEAEFDNILRCEESMWWFRGMRDIVRATRSRFPAPPSRRILDAGCGTTYFAGWLRDQHQAPCFGIDLSRRAMQIARRQLHFVNAAQADLRALPFPDGCFDAVYSMDVLVHFPPGEERQPLAELVRVLHPSGFLMLRVAAHRILRSNHSQFAHERQRFRRRPLIELARQCGLDVAFCSYVNSLLSPVALIKFRLFEPLFRRQPESGVKPFPPLVDALFYRILSLEAAWIRRGGTFPFGQSLLLLARKQPREAA